MGRIESGSKSGGLIALFEAGPTAGQDEAALLERFLGGDPEEADRAFAALVARHGSLVLSVARQILRDDHAAQDACQATFLILARRAGSIRRPEALASWLFGVARRVAHHARVDRARRAARERRAAVSDSVRADPPAFEADDRLALIDEVGRLPEPYRGAVVLCDLQGLTYEAAARQLRCPLGTLSVRLRRARERLRVRLMRRGVSPIPAFPLGNLSLPPIRLASVPSPPVAALAARSLLMMRLGSLTRTTFGLLALAGGTFGVGLGVVAFARWQEPVPSPRLAVVPKPPAPRSWSRAIPEGGPTVTLVGVTPGGAEPRAWTDPNGRPLAEPPYTRPGFTLYPQGDERAWELALRFPDPAKRLDWRCRAVGSGGGNAAGPQPADDSGRSRNDDLKAFGVCLPRSVRNLTIRIEVAHRPWRTLRTCGSAGSAAHSSSRETPGVIFGTGRQVGDRTVLTVSHNVRDDAVRVVAVDASGAESTAWRFSSYGIGVFDQIEVEFGLPLSEVREFRLQTRPYDAVTFDDIPLSSTAVLTPKP